jgi:hypothetical protein
VRCDVAAAPSERLIAPHAGLYDRVLNRTGWLWLILLGPGVAGVVAALSPFAAAHVALPSRIGYLVVLALVWLSPLRLIWTYERD